MDFIRRCRNTVLRHGSFAALVLQVYLSTILGGAFAAVTDRPIQPAQRVQHERATNLPVMMHIHGLAYSRDGRRLFLATHYGLAVYHAGRWSMAPGPADDLTAIVATRDGLFSSGYTSTSAHGTNPLGLQRSLDYGATWTVSTLGSQSVFRIMAASYSAGAIYVYNDTASIAIGNPGFYYTLSDGKAWISASARQINIASAAHSLAVHPTKPNVVAASTDGGLLISTDFGQHFRHVFGRDFALAAWFDFDGDHIWVSQYRTTSRLSRLRWEDGRGASDVALPFSDGDGVAAISQSPVEPHQIAILTFKRDVYISSDGGRTWRRIVDKGKVN